ncbi:MAG: twin-arginine translocase subunit TatC [Chloroflexota bacterium]|nr:twin-arginine translocase subunit TatC [Chloroflexota bacterium]
MSHFLQRVWRIITAPFRCLAQLFGKIGSFFTDEPEDTPIPAVFAKAVKQPSDILEHLNDLRKNLFRAIIVLVVTTALSFIFIQDLLTWLTQPIGGIESLQAIEVTEPLGVAMRVALLAGFAVALPYIILELWMFAAPGLRRRARLWGLVAIPLATLFFVGGMAFAYYVMMPAALPFLLNILGIKTAVRPASYVRFATSLMFWIGIAFQFPLIIFALAGIGLIRAKTLAKQWRIAVVIIAVMAAAITPTIDPVNMGLVMGPMILLYFLSIGLAYLAQGKRDKKT